VGPGGQIAGKREEPTLTVQISGKVCSINLPSSPNRSCATHAMGGLRRRAPTLNSVQERIGKTLARKGGPP
jgi:hypothetical protein